jgi:hypothetical protein
VIFWGADLVLLKEEPSEWEPIFEYHGKPLEWYEPLKMVSGDAIVHNIEHRPIGDDDE